MGYMSFGHAMFYAAGAYVGIFALRTFDNIIVSYLCVLGCVALLSLVVGYVCVHSRGVYFCLSTFAFSVITWFMLVSWIDYTGGSNGMSLPGLPPFFLDLENPRIFYYFSLAHLVIAFSVFWFVSKSFFGKVLLAIKTFDFIGRFLNSSFILL